MVAKQMDGTVVVWDVQTLQNRIVCTIPEKRWFAYAAGMDQLLVRTADENVAIVDLETDVEMLLTKGAYDSGSLSDDGRLAVLSEGDEQVEVWQITPNDEQARFRKLKILETVLPVRNGLALGYNSQLMRQSVAMDILSPQQKGVTEMARDIGQSLRFGVQPMNVQYMFSILARF